MKAPDMLRQPVGEATTRRGFFAMLAAVAAAPFVAKPAVHWLGAVEVWDAGEKHRKGHGAQLAIMNDDGAWITIPEVQDITFDQVVHPTLKTSTGGDVMVPRLNRETMKARFIDG